MSNKEWFIYGCYALVLAGIFGYIFNQFLDLSPEKAGIYAGWSAIIVVDICLYVYKKFSL